MTGEGLGDDIDLDLLRADVVGDVFGGDGEGVAADGQAGGDGERAGAGEGARVPAQGDGGYAFEASGEGAGGGGGLRAQLEGFAAMEAWCG